MYSERYSLRGRQAHGRQRARRRPSARKVLMVVTTIEAVEALLDRRSEGPPPRDRGRTARHRSALEKIGTPGRGRTAVRSSIR